MAVALLWTGCEGRDDIDPKQGNPFMLSVYLPVEETYAPMGGGPLRVMGDPGTMEKFALPNYIYIFIVNEVAEDTWKVWDQITIDDAGEYWHKEYYSGVLMGNGDSIYRYTREIIKPLEPTDKFKGRVYAIVSEVALTFDATLTNGTSTEADLLNLGFSTAGEMQRKLQNIYSTPYNYEVGGKYYGSFDSEEHNVPYINLMLYHVAAKVDINWFVDEEKRSKTNMLRLTKMDACNLFNGNAFCFKPMENSLDALPTTTDSVHIVTRTDEGLWWEGRSYFYTIPYTTTEKTGYYPLQMQMETNESGAIYKPTVYLEVNTTSPFVPWLRATFNINNPLAAGTAEKTVPLTP